VTGSLVVKKFCDLKKKGHPLKNHRILKTITWTFSCFTMATIVAFIVTGNPVKAFTIGGAEILWESPLFFTHETVWRKIARHFKE
jgi:uncharacterized membrane protein